VRKFLRNTTVAEAAPRIAGGTVGRGVDGVLVVGLVGPGLPGALPTTINCLPG
jgi:hypothetical protein